MVLKCSAATFSLVVPNTDLWMCVECGDSQGHNLHIILCLTSTHNPCMLTVSKLVQGWVSWLYHKQK